ncbi:MAG: primosomal protein N' (replication factor Y) [Saprospiraceae bacterium]
MDKKIATYVEVLLPLAIPQTYTYAVPLELVERIGFGLRVEVPIKNKLLSGLIAGIHQEKPISKTRNIISILDDQPIIQEVQFDFWIWIASYYLCHLGEVMSVALPGGLKLSSETMFVFHPDTDLSTLDLTDDEHLVAGALSIQHEMNIGLIQDILDKKTVLPLIKRLMQKRVISVKEELRSKYKVLMEDYVAFIEPFDKQIEDALALTSRSEKQSRAILGLGALSRKTKHVAKKALYEMSLIDSAIIRALEKKGIISVYQQEISRIGLEDEGADYKLFPLSSSQQKAHQLIREHHANNKVTLLHGITGSGKTRIYVELILEALAEGGQVLLLLPEIALTSQIVERLNTQIGDMLHVYHSKINDQQKVEIWNTAMYANKLFVGARSALFLPFSDLKLIIVDEEHDSSFKQNDPAPRYHGRDAAIKLAQLYGAKVVLGTATPSLESMHNTTIGKYEYVPLMERYGEAILPIVEIIDLKDAYKKGLVKEHFSQQLLDEIQETIKRGGQILLFQNRRGFAPVLKCQFCAWTAECPNCDVTLTYHQRIQDLKCHYCGYRQRKTDQCPDCGNHDLQLLGSGTERIEEVIEQLLPGVRVARFDYDTTRSKKSQDKILTAFRNQELDILVGTQMITKGFDFENIELVGVINADSLLSYPDFRSGERSFQLLMQVAGRAGRRKKQGRVLIQAFSTDHPILKEVLNGDFNRFYSREEKERQEFVYPPHYSLVAIWFRHRDFTKTKMAAAKYASLIKSKIGRRLQGPVDPPVIRVRNQYQQVIYIRIEKDAKSLKTIKGLILGTKLKLQQDKEVKQVRVTIDVDPY